MRNNFSKHNLGGNVLKSNFFPYNILENYSLAFFFTYKTDMEDFQIFMLFFSLMFNENVSSRSDMSIRDVASIVVMLN